MPEAPLPERLKPRPETPVVEEALVLETPEALPEQTEAAEEAPGQEPGKKEEAIAAEEQPSARAPAKPAQVRVEKDQLTREIEDVMQEGLTDVFLKMKPKEQKAFKDVGEQTASKIRQVVSQTKVNAKKILDLLKRWLRLIPGVNKFFLEQEAKIKTDKILLVAEEEKKRRGDQLS